MLRTNGFWMIAPLAALAACGGASDKTGSSTVNRTDMPEQVAPAMPIPTTSPAAVAVATPIPASDTAPNQPQSCAAEIGTSAAAVRVAVCRNVSPATHPPCNAANSCAMIEDEIARSCALFDVKGAPMAGCTPSPKSAAAAVAVVQRYYSAINARDYATAWSQWGDTGRPGQKLAAFTAGFTHTRSSKVTVGRLEPGDAGAGSSYQPVPVTVDATLDNGAHQRFRGTYVLRRVNDVDGASAGQLRWHIGSAQLQRVAVD